MKRNLVDYEFHTADGLISLKLKKQPFPASEYHVRAIHSRTCAANFVAAMAEYPTIDSSFCSTREYRLKTIKYDKRGPRTAVYEEIVK